jgi:hypothetical protein
MKLAGSFVLLILVAAAPDAAGPSIPYFTNVRDVQVAQSGRQNYFIVDEEIWDHSRPDLGDLRLYDAQSLVQYAISEQRAGVASEEVEAKILNLGSVSGHTEFDLDAGGLAEYDRIRLRLDAHDFVATASVSGGSAPGKATEVELTPSTLYDFTKEQLGSNSQLKLPTSSFRYLHVKLSTGIRPDQVKGASIYNLREKQALWSKAGTCAAPRQKPRATVIVCDVPNKVPLSHISLQIAPSQVNFWRTVSVEDSKGVQLANAEISRVRVNRAGVLVINEELAIAISGASGQLTVSIDNGENPPLTITAADPLALERRVYFDPQGKSQLRLYYGDEKLTAPVYDYQRFFHLEDMPAMAQLGPGAHNPGYTGRPDDRPWSEQHMGILWAAMVLAVLGLAFLALRGLRNAGSR